MSWPLKYDPASQSISFGGRDKTLYPNSLVPFDQAVLAAGDVCRTYCDHDSSRRPSPENEFIGVADEKFENKKAGGTGSAEDRCALDRSLHSATSISYTKIDQLEESKQKRFVESLARGKWNRYRRQYTSNRSYEAPKSTNSLPTDGRASAFPNSPSNLPYLALSDTRCAPFNNQAPRDLSLKDRTTKGGEWSSVSLPASPGEIITITEEDPAIIYSDHSISESKPSTLPERPCSPHSSLEEKRAPIRAFACPRQARIAFNFWNKGTSCGPNVRHKQSFFQKLLHPRESIIKPVIRLATKVFCLKQNKIQQGEKDALGVDITGKVLSKRDVKEWRAMRGYGPLFTRKWVQSVAKAVEKGREKEEVREVLVL